MDIEQMQAEHIQHFVKQASTINGSTSSLVNIIVQATSHPSLFAFTEILSVPNLLEVSSFAIVYKFQSYYVHMIGVSFLLCT
ncbi:hypothetical protein HanOQP8_Chr17g0672861 [Helianthus annuus]|nr:hypothetical protein HanLR1_Chr17g0678071 [Helianthus annuus]KAJ0637357.1 hypothetical protein HanOQP8_Chr17g0672861 [Helianthus annuus]